MKVARTTFWSGGMSLRRQGILPVSWGQIPRVRGVWRLVQKVGLAVASGKEPLGHHAGGRLVHLYQDRVAIVRQVI